MFRRFLQKVWRSSQSFSRPLVEVHIHKEKLLENLHAFQKLGSVAPVLKSNAYGHGLVEVARVLERERVPFLCVDSYFEARVLRDAGLNAPLLVLGWSRPEYILENIYKDVAFTVGSSEQLEQLRRAGTDPRTLHIKVNTGLNRQGISPDEVPTLFPYAGIMSHLADADGLDPGPTLEQIKRWNSIASTVPAPYKHLAATAGARNYNEDIDANVMRIGLGLYTNTLSVHTIVTGVRDILPGDAVGYSRTFIAREKMKVAVVPVGYFEGVDRRLSNKGVVIVSGRACPIVGRVSMNFTTVDVTAVPEVATGMPVTVISDNPDHKNSIERIAQICGTIPHEILVHIPQHLRRAVV